MEDKSLEMAETMKSILFWQKVIVALFVVGLVLLGSMAGTLWYGYTSLTECIVREEAKDPRYEDLEISPELQKMLEEWERSNSDVNRLCEALRNAWLPR